MDEKKKRGRPKKIIDDNQSIESDNKIKKKRGRKKKIDTIYHLPLTIKTNNKEESNYIVMLDIKYSDLDMTINENKKIDKLLCDDLIQSFGQLIQQRQYLYTNECQLKPVHQTIISPMNIKTDFYSSYERKEINMAILPIFQINGNNWPTSSTYSCWNCDCQFSCSPIGIPEKIVNNQFYCSGNFCSFPCAGRYIVDNDSSVNRFEKLSALNYLYQIAYGLEITDFVKIANPKQTLHKYGGCQSYTEYHSNEEEQKIEIYKLPIIPLYYYICNDTSNEQLVEEITKEIINFE